MRTLRLQSGPQFQSWESKGFRIVKECIQKLAESLVYDIVQPGTQKVTRSDAERWLRSNGTFVTILEHVFSHLYHYRASKAPQEDPVNVRRKSLMSESVQLLPFCEGQCEFVWRRSKYLSIGFNVLFLFEFRFTICTRLSGIYRYLTNVIH